MSSRYGGGGDRYGRGADRYSGGGDSRRHSSSSRRDSPPRHRSRRSPSPGPSRRSPKPRDPKTLPESFGRVVDESRTDDDLSVLQRMRSHYKNSPLQCLYDHLENKVKVKIWTRNYKEVRGVMTGYIIAFDKHWNILLSDVDEVFLKSKKNKTPFLRDIAPNENLPDIPAKVPKQKAESADPPPPPPEPKEGEKKKQRSKKAKQVSEKRQLGMLFIRGDNIVIVSRAEENVQGEEEEEEEEEVEEGEEGAINRESG